MAGSPYVTEFVENSVEGDDLRGRKTGKEQVKRRRSLQDTNLRGKPAGFRWDGAEGRK